MIRQGDLIFVPTTQIPVWFREQAKKQRNGIIARGEATGHSHRIAVLEDAEVFAAGRYDSSETIFVKVGPNGVSIVHEEHKPVMLEPNTNYEVKRAREYDYLSNLSRIVRD